MRVEARFWTAIIIIGFCGFAVVRGWSIVHFSFNMASTASLIQRSDVLADWAEAPGIGSTARQLKLKDTVDPSDWDASNNRSDELSALLAINPLSSTNWLLLAGMQSVTEQPRERVQGSLMLSWVTGPNEGYVMAERGVFGLSLWESLPPDLRAHVAVDLAADQTMERGNFRALLATKPEDVRKDVRMALLARGLSAKEVEKRLGL